MPSRARGARVIASRAALAGLLGTLILGSVGTASAAASRSQWSVFEDHPHLVYSPPAKREALLNEVKDLGADTIRVEVKWNEVAPSPSSRTRPTFDATDPHQYPGFGPYDALITSAAAKAFRILITITGDAPRWATVGERGDNYRPEPDEYARFVAAVGKRYSGAILGLPKVAYFSIWNEPNHQNFIKPTRDAPLIYRELVDVAIPALQRSAAAEAKIFVGELKPTSRKGVGPKKFIQDWLCLDERYRKLRGRAARKKACKSFKKIDADGFAHHPYGPTELRPKKQDILNMNVIRRLGTILDKAAKAKRLPRKLPIYNTEFGLQSNPPDIFVGTSPERQAALINEKEEFSYRYARLKSFSQYQLYDDPARSGPAAVKWSGFQTGLRFSNGDKKPAYDAFRFPIVVRDTRRSVTIWGRVRPGGGARYVQLQKRSGSRYVNSGGRIATNSAGYFARKKESGKYRFLAYVREGSGYKLLGTSRAANPKRLATR
jgi:hypothetical protein